MSQHRHHPVTAHGLHAVWCLMELAGSPSGIGSLHRRHGASNPLRRHRARQQTGTCQGMKAKGFSSPLIYYAVALCVTCAVTAIAYVAHTMINDVQSPVSDSTEGAEPRLLMAAAPVHNEASMLFRNTALGDAYGRLAV